MLKIQLFLFLQPISYNQINTFTNIYCASYYLPSPGGGLGTVGERVTYVSICTYLYITASKQLF